MPDTTTEEEAYTLDDVEVTGTRNPFSISTFIRELDKRGGPLAQNLFTVNMSLPSSIGNSEQNRVVSLFCDSAPLPGIALGTDESIQRYGYGPTYRAVWGAVFTGFSLDFILDNKGTVHRIFTKWIDSIVKFNTPEHITTATQSGQPFFISYPDDYTTDITIYNYDPRAKKVIQTTYYDAFPIRIAENQMNNAANNSYMKLAVGFSCVRWTVEYHQLTDDLSNTIATQNDQAAYDLYNADAQNQVYETLANDLNMTYSRLNFNFNPSSSTAPSITDTTLTNTNGILTQPSTRFIDINFDIDSLFPKE